jgi:hypothetical protein
MNGNIKSNYNSYTFMIVILATLFIWSFTPLPGRNRIKIYVIFTLILSGQTYRQDYSEDVIIDGEQYFDGPEKILHENNWHKPGHDPKMMSHGNYYK